MSVPNDINHCFNVKSVKNIGFSLSQNKRRKQMLKKQRERKENKLDRIRELAMISSSSNDSHVNKNDNKDSMDIDNNKINKKKRENNELYRNHLMKHELLEDIPDDLESEWLCVPIPQGQRCLVISSSHKTFVRSFEGDLMFSFFSYLPNGSQSSSEGKTHSYCLFDCIFNEDSKTFYILDMMCWKGNLYYNCDTQFRFYFLQSKISEISYVSQISERNPYKFISLPVFTCTLQGIQESCSSTITGFPISLITFYNKNSHYCTGEESNPLVCYLQLDKMGGLIQYIEQNINK